MKRTITILTGMFAILAVACLASPAGAVTLTKYSTDPTATWGLTLLDDPTVTACGTSPTWTNLAYMVSQVAFDENSATAMHDDGYPVGVAWTVDFGSTKSIEGFYYMQHPNAAYAGTTGSELILSVNSDFSSPVTITGLSHDTGASADTWWKFSESVTARYVRWKITAKSVTYGAAAEMNFYTPEPATVAILGLGSLVLLLKRR